MTNAIAAEGLAAGYGSRPVWSGANFKIQAGTFTAVLGPNGAGKSTLIKLMLGLLAPRAGRLEVLGAEARRGNPRIGYLPQTTAFDPEFSIRGRDLVGMGLDGHHWGPGLPIERERRASAIDEAIHAVGAELYADRALGRLSGGELQRLLLAQALAGQPELLLLDEPLGHLDVRNQARIVELVREVAAAGEMTVLLISHDVNPLLRHLDTVLFVAQGRIEIGKPSEIITSEALSRIYSAPVEVLTDSLGRVFVVGLEDETNHPHG